MDCAEAGESRAVVTVVSDILLKYRPITMRVIDSREVERTPASVNGHRQRPHRLLGRYARWLHTQWPAGTVEKLPAVNPDGSTRVPGLYVAGDLTGIPLLKFAADTGARAVQTIAGDPAFRIMVATHHEHLDTGFV